MTEIEKMFENAGIKKIELDYPDNIDPFYPDFTAEKQIEICKLLLKAQHSISYYFYKNRYGFVIDDKQDDCIEAKKFETALAMIVNYLWQSLTYQEKKEIRGILNENS